MATTIAVKNELKRRRDMLNELYRIYIEWFDSGKYIIDGIDWEVGTDVVPTNTGEIRREPTGGITFTIRAHKQGGLH